MKEEKRVGKLLDMINRYYELQLCYVELKEFGASDITHDLLNHSFLFSADNIDDLLFRSSWLSEVDGRRTFIAEVIDACKEITWKFPDLWFPHIAYPFKGRMRPQVARSLINIVCPRRRGIILDPFCGSGTTNVEAYLCGLDSVGIDIIPFYTFMSEAKIRFFEDEIKSGLEGERNHPIQRVVHSACTILKTKVTYEKRMREIRALQRIYFNRFKNMIPKTKHEFKVGTATSIPYPDEHFDGIVCSPPYGTALDYEKENPGPKELMEIPHELKRFIVLSKDEIKWKELMLLAFKEMHRVLKSKGRLAIIIGNQRRNGRTVDYVGWSKRQLDLLGFKLLYQFTELISSTGTKSILSDEILIFEKVS